MGEQAEGIGITFEVGEIGPHSFAHMPANSLARIFGKETPYGFFAAVPERWITHIVGVTGCLYNRSYLLE